MSQGKCGPDSYYDGLVETCKPCYLRCTPSPPLSCRAFCTKPPGQAGSDNRSVWFILLVFLLLSTFTTLVLLVQILRKKRCRFATKCQENKGEHAEETGRPAVTEGTSAHPGDLADINSDYNSSLPLPSTEEGNTILVTTKTAPTQCDREPDV